MGMNTYYCRACGAAIDPHSEEFLTTFICAPCWDREMGCEPLDNVPVSRLRRQDLFVTLGRTMSWDAEDRRLYVITRSMERRREELAPVRAEIARLIDEIGWRRALPLARAALGRPVQRQGLWSLGKKDTVKVLEALRNPKGQLALFNPRGPVTSAGQPAKTRTACGGDSPCHQEPA